MEKLYRCTESGEILTEAQLQAEFETLKAEEPETYNYNIVNFGGGFKKCLLIFWEVQKILQRL